MLHPSYVDLMEVVNKNVEEGETPVINSRYSIVMATAKRARQIVDGDEPLVKVTRGEKPLSIAVDELNQSEIRILAEDEVEEEYLDFLEEDSAGEIGSEDEVSGEELTGDGVIEPAENALAENYSDNSGLETEAAEAEQSAAPSPDQMIPEKSVSEEEVMPSDDGDSVSVQEEKNTDSLKENISSDEEDKEENASNEEEQA